MNGLQDYRLKGQQFNALSQQPEAALQGQNIQNQTAQMKQNEDASQIAAHYFGTLPDDAKPDDIYRMKMAIRAVHPNISAATINTVADVALRDPKLERAIGVIYLPQTERQSHYFDARLADQFDAVIHFDETSALQPLERRALWETGEPPETFPTGI